MDRLTEDHFSFKCPMRWEDMAVSANGRFCEQCRKEVFDLSNCSVEEVSALQQKHGSICGSIRVVRATAVAVSLSAAACQSGDHVRTTGTPLPTEHKSCNPPSNIVAGGIRPIHETNEVVVPGRIAPMNPEGQPDESSR
jgi:hypothetical protein